MTILSSTGPRNATQNFMHSLRSLSAAAGCQVFAKLDLLQPSGSFKIHGVGNMIWQTAQRFAEPLPPTTLLLKLAWECQASSCYRGKVAGLEDNSGSS
jgi:hypothetical protein